MLIVFKLQLGVLFSPDVLACETLVRRSTWNLTIYVLMMAIHLRYYEHGSEYGASCRFVRVGWRIREKSDGAGQDDPTTNTPSLEIIYEKQDSSKLNYSQ